MTIPFLPYALPDIGEDEIAEVVAVLQSGWLTTGPRTKRFEEDFSAFLGGGVTSLAVNSATSGLHLALEALGVGPGDEVITTTHTFTATAEVVRYLGADPVFVDIREDTLNIDPALVAAAITPRTKVILPVHFAGLGADVPALHAIAAPRGIAIVEDAAHAIPTTVGGRLVGTHGSAATVFSFYANKTLATGEGGMVVTADPAIAARCKVMRLHGIDRDAFDRFRSERPAWFYEVVAPGFKYNLPDLASAVGIHQLRRVRAMQQRREAMAARYDAAFADLPLVLPPRPPAGDEHAWHLYVVRLADTALERDACIARLAAEGIGTSVHYIPLHLQPYWRDRYGLNAAQFPASQRVYERCLSLPLYSRMTDSDVARVIDTVRRVVTS